MTSIYSASLLQSVHKTNIDTPHFFSFKNNNNNKRKAVWERFGKRSRPLTQCLKHQSAAKNIKAATTLVLNG